MKIRSSVPVGHDLHFCTYCMSGGGCWTFCDLWATAGLQPPPYYYARILESTTLSLEGYWCSPLLTPQQESALGCFALCRTTF